MKYGYVRVSTKDQHIDRQMTVMREQGIEDAQIFIDKVSGRNFRRKKYQTMLKKLKENDELFVKSIDRLGRNYDEIIEQWNFLTRIKNVNIIVLDCPLLDTRKQVNGVTGKFIADLVLQILSYVAQVERENTHQRQMEGIREAKIRGVRFGRPTVIFSEEYGDILKKWRKGEISIRKGADVLGMAPNTLAKWLKSAGRGEIKTG